MKTILDSLTNLLSLFPIKYRAIVVIFFLLCATNFANRYYHVKEGEIDRESLEQLVRDVANTNCNQGG